MRQITKSDIDGKICLNGRIFDYSMVSLRPKRMSFLLKKTILHQIETEVEKLDYKDPNLFWSSKKSPNGNLIDENHVWWKIDGDFEWRLHENVGNMPNFFELTLLLIAQESTAHIVDISDIRHSKIQTIFQEENDLPFL